MHILHMNFRLPDSTLSRQLLSSAGGFLCCFVHVFHAISGSGQSPKNIPFSAQRSLRTQTIDKLQNCSKARENPSTVQIWNFYWGQKATKRDRKGLDDIFHFFFKKIGIYRETSDSVQVEKYICVIVNFLYSFAIK